MSSLERFPQAQSNARAAVLPAKRIVHSHGELGVAEVLRLVDVVEEVVEPAARHGGPAFRESPADCRGQTRREREEVLAWQLGVVLKGARQVEERHPRSDGDGPRLPDGEV